MWQVEPRFHSQLPMATVWAYGASQATATTPGPTIEAVRGYPIDVRWSNHLPDRHLLAASVDTSLHMAHPARGIPTVVHLHGAETEPGSDGFPESWFTAEFAEKGPTWEKETYHYENEQRSTLLWYHDHALGFTRLNIYAGVAGLYILRDPANDPRTLPSGRYEVPLILQDRMFHADGSLAYPTTGVNPDHPQWQPEFFGNVICVNGTAWPHLDVEPRRYRFRVVNASGSRFYRLGVATEDPAWSEGPTIRQIGTDGGLLRKAVWIAGGPGRRNHALLVAPAERADVIVDFTGLPVGSRFVLTNDAATPFPGGDPYCHISEHEDNEMMRPYQVVGATVAKQASVAATSGEEFLSLHEGGAPRAVTLVVSRLAMVDLDVLDVSGRRLRELLRRALPPGTYGYAWDGLDESGRKVPRGVYFVRAHSGMESATLKLVLAP